MKKSKIYFLAGFLSLFLLSFVELEDTSDRFEVGKNLDIFTEVYKQVNSLYVDGTQPGELMKVGIDAMLESLDPYTVYYPESDIENYKLMTTGQYGGIGARIRKIDDFVVVGEPYVGFPAFKAGLRGGDVILKVDGKDVKGKSTSDLSKILKGNPGTSITVTIQRPGIEASFEVSFKREKVQIKSVPYQGMITENIGYIKMKSFTRNVSKEVKTAFLELKKNPNFQSLVFDLRGNPGGLLHEAINTVGLFTKKGVKVVETRGKIEEWTKIYKTLNAPLDKEIPIVILVDGGSASASEIVSGALQDFDRAVILGSNTYGKGLVQTTRNLKYNTSIKVTTAKYYIPSGRCIQAIDYAHKDEDGNPKKIPDSLLTEFKTQNGRLVLDGAGIKPDVEKNRERYGAITRALLSKNHVFNFATQYVLKHDSISNAKNFRLTDDEYQSFITYLLDNEYDYQTSTGKGLKALKKRAEKDSILVDIASEIKLIEDKIILKKKSDLKKFKSQIKGFLEIEIASRYFFQIGKIESSLGNDFFVDEAVEILTNNERYTSILSGN
ncbi:MAG: carboxyl-terminal processing protease [Flavobacteriales bacterium]|jgi:carboxyl-terminal processing protease|tara:strand:- start:289 stop:1944 length:1656 start_codon:yes stop_codon:yes gene_type:complete